MMIKILPALVIALLEHADAFTVDDSPILHSFNNAYDSLAEAEDPEDIVFGFNWYDDGGQEYSVDFTEGGISQAEVDEAGTVHLPDHEGEPSKIQFFALKKINPLEIKS